jgi:hypothetical protein
MPDPSQCGLLIDLRDTTAHQDSIPSGLSPVSLAEIQRQHGQDWIFAFAQGLGSLNAARSAVPWWAYTSTAKNLLSSPLGNRLFQALAALKFIEVTHFDKLYVVGATAGQCAIISATAKHFRSDMVVHGTEPADEFSTAEVVVRLLYQTLRMAWVLLCWRGRFSLPLADVYAFTYVDANVTEDTDAFFGDLQRLLAQQSPAVNLSYIAFIQAPYRTVLPKLRGIGRKAPFPLLLYLSISDLWWALRLSFSASRPSQERLSNINAISGTHVLLAEALRWDVAKGGYFYNLLVYKAMARFARRHTPKRVIYPFENKSLEKLLLHGLRESSPTCRIVGYQHTSITPRHTTFHLTENEVKATPLPDLVVTAGDVTRHHLEKTGNFRPDLFATGCALRQRYTGTIAADDNTDHEPTRVLLALSSSKFELVTAVEFMRSVKSILSHLAIGVRPHPEFPLSLLPEHCRTWVAEHAMDFSGSALADNIAWCTATAYVSSTVALETLMRGKPVINLDLGEIVAPDPALDPPPLWRRVSTPQGFLTALDSLRTASPQEKRSAQNATMQYVQSYFRPPTAEAIRVFLS